MTDNFDTVFCRELKKIALYYNFYRLFKNVSQRGASHWRFQNWCPPLLLHENYYAHLWLWRKLHLLLKRQHWKLYVSVNLVQDIIRCFHIYLAPCIYEYDSYEWNTRRHRQQYPEHEVFSIIVKSLL